MEVRAELLVAIDDDHDVRIREIISLLDPVSGSLLTDGAEIAMVGIPGDGVNDSFEYRIQVDAVAEGQADRFVVHLTVDGLDAPPMTAAQGEAISDTSWVVSGELPLGQDAQDGQILKLESWVELPDGGISVCRHSCYPWCRCRGVGRTGHCSQLGCTHGF